MVTVQTQADLRQFREATVLRTVYLMQKAILVVGGLQQRTANSVPGFIHCGMMIMGFTETTLEKKMGMLLGVSEISEIKYPMVNTNH